MSSLSVAQKRALSKAIQHGFVMRAGSFSQGPVDDDVLARPDFDRGHVVDRLIARGLLQPGDGFNQYEPTGRGLEVASRWRTQGEAQ